MRVIMESLISGENKKEYSKSGSLIFRFAIIFAVFTMVTIVLSGTAAYFVQTRMHKKQVEKAVSKIAEYLSFILSDEALDFENHQKYLIDHADEIAIPYDYDHNYIPARDTYEEMFAHEFPGKVYGRDVSFEEMSDELKRARAVYVQEYCLKMFEEARDIFDVAYTYYMVPSEGNRHCYYVIDAIREERKEGKRSLIKLALDVDENLDKVPVLWNVWNAKKPLHEFEIYNNEYGYVYGYYYPLMIGGRPIGLIAVDYEIDDSNEEILGNTFSLCGALALVLVISVVVLLLVIDRKHLRRLVRLAGSVKNFTNTKNPEIAQVIEAEIKGRDEVSDLARHTAAMISELDKYMKNLVNTTKELSETRQQAKGLAALANRDSLTGVRNRIAYDDEIKRLQREAVHGSDKFGIAFVDLDNLTAINDEFGYDKGNVAIKQLCMLVCNTFKHSPVFRVGCDEFAVILRNGDLKMIDELTRTFCFEIERRRLDDALEPFEKVSAAMGIALFDPERDFTVEDVCRRAEEEMLSKKQGQTVAGE